MCKEMGMGSQRALRCRCRPVNAVPMEVADRKPYKLQFLSSILGAQDSEMSV
jgi:hypothetical protein